MKLWSYWCTGKTKHITVVMNTGSVHCVYRVMLNPLSSLGLNHYIYALSSTLCCPSSPQLCKPHIQSKQQHFWSSVHCGPTAPIKKSVSDCLKWLCNEVHESWQSTCLNAVSQSKHAKPRSTWADSSAMMPTTLYHHLYAVWISSACKYHCQHTVIRCFL